jgi:hypothetical protein
MSAASAAHSSFCRRREMRQPGSVSDAVPRSGAVHTSHLLALVGWQNPEHANDDIDSMTA